MVRFFYKREMYLLIVLFLICIVGEEDCYCQFLSVNRYILKIADIFGVTVDIFEKSLIYFELRRYI
ncbi:hypothetical protein EXW31_05900 [Bacillus mycoides]|nr:hypothetical protein EXW58_05545 [Bacillus mycoides]QWG43853.1 hypothetical protein EXW31_05900 [Bacillus mycoides]CAH2462445.1 hypothetical protein ACOSJ1_EBGNOMHC_03549 [Bacillus mycoides KBAB4]